jgi:hypothetical protein
MERKYKAIITGPNEYLPGGVLVESFEITQDEINEYLSEEDDETEEDAINYYKEEYIAEWAQRWCTAQLLTEEKIDAAENIFNDDDGEEEEEEESEWDEWE